MMMMKVFVHAASDQKLEVGRPGNEATLIEKMCSHWYAKLLSVLLLRLYQIDFTLPAPRTKKCARQFHFTIMANRTH